MNGLADLRRVDTYQASIRRKVVATFNIRSAEGEIGGTFYQAANSGDFLVR
jgi:hypothetical protein